MGLRLRDLTVPVSTELNLPVRKVRLVLPEALRVPMVWPYLRSSIQNAYFLAGCLCSGGCFHVRFGKVIASYLRFYVAVD
jgi:hypothetical protein